MVNLIGRTVKIDYNTQNSQQKELVSEAVDIDLDQSLKGQADIDGEL